MKVLYIDTRLPGHNAELHVDFIKFMHEKGFCKIIPYGNNLRSRFSGSIKIKQADVSRQFDRILSSYNPDAILTYNKNGSGYDSQRDNISLYQWLEEPLSKASLPKFHITTDYCRSGYREEQANWFGYMGYSAAIFRTQESLQYPCSVDTFCLPFSVDSAFYSKFNKTNYLSKKRKVAFLGTANQNPFLYSGRIAAIKALEEKRLLSSSKIIDKEKGIRQMIIGNGYHRFLSKHMFGLTCGGTCNYMTAKYFQIPALRSMLICTDTIGLDMFPDETYIKYSAENIEKLINDVEYYLSNKKEAEEKAMVLTNHVLKNHNHKVRSKQLVSFMKKYL
jgi:hypothetical protein